MKLAHAIAAILPLLAKDQKPEDVRRVLIAADKKAKDNSGLGPKELEKEDQAKAQDAAMDARECSMDEREEAMDAAEEMSDKDKTDDKAKDRKSARDARKMGRDSRKAGRDARAMDRDDDPEHTNDENYLESGDPSTPGGNRAGGKTAVDSAEVDRRIKAAVERDRASRESLITARKDVEPILGVVAMDSSAAVYKAAFDKLGIDVTGADPSSYPVILKLAKDRAQAAPAAMDSAGSTDFAKSIKGFDRLK